MKRLVLLLAPLAVFAAAPNSDWSPNVTASAAWLGNATNGEAVWDRVDALQLSLDALSSSRYELGRTDAVHATMHLAGDWYPRFLALDRGAVGARVDWQHTFGNDAFAPVFTIEAAGDFVTTVETARRGTSGAITLNLQKKIGASWRVALRERFDRYDAKRSVFDSQSNETAFEIGRDINEATRLTFTGRWREGDVVTYAQYTRPDLEAVAHDSAPLKTFHLDMTAYASEARTIAARLALVHATSDESAVVLAYEYARTDRTGMRFANQVISVSIVRQY